MHFSDSSLFRMTAAMAASGLAITLLKIALPVLAGSMGSSAVSVSLVAGSIAITWPVFGLLAGWALDRFGCLAGFRTGLLATALAAAALPLLTGTFPDPVLLLCALGLLVGLGEVLTETSGQAILPNLVNADRFHHGNSLLQGAKTVSATLLAPFLIALLLENHATEVFVLAFLIVFLGLLALPGRRQLKADQANGSRGFFEGARLLWRRSDHRSLTLLLALMSVSWGAWMTLIIPYALSADFLDIGTSGVGYVITAMGCGSLLGAAGYRHLRARLGDNGTRVLDPLATVIFVLVPALGLGLVPVFASAFLAGIGGVTWAISIAAHQQSTLPAGSLGRSIAAYRWVGWTGFFLGASLSGLVADIIGLQLAFLFFALPAMVALIGTYQDFRTSAHQTTPRFEATGPE